MSASADSGRRLTPLEPLLDAVEGAAVLDLPAKPAGNAVRAAVTGALKDLASGTWLGHPVHPLLTDVVIGSFTSATLLDLTGGSGAAAERLIAVGALAYGPTALTGASDWADSEQVDAAVRRAGIAHATVNAAGLVLYLLSLRARRRGRRLRGALLGLAGLSAFGLGGYLGGHLAYARGVGVDQTLFDEGSEEWVALLDSDALAEGSPAQVVAGDAPVLLVRHGSTIHAIHDRCSHRGCSLAGGTLEGEEIVCPCHGSRFDVRTGAVRGGPAAAPQPLFAARERDGRIEVRRAP